MTTNQTSAQHMEALDAGLDLLLPPDHSNVLGLLMRDTGQALDDLVEWYETIHAPNADHSFPFMRRYARNYIVGVEQGPKPPYRVLTEFEWKDQEAKISARASFKSDAALEAAASEFSGSPPAWLLDIYSILIPTESKRFGAPLHIPGMAEPVRRRAMLLRCPAAVLQEAFEAEVTRFGKQIAQSGSGIGVSIELCRGPLTSDEEPGAVLFVDGIPEGKWPRPEADFCDVMNVFLVEMRQSLVDDTDNE